MKFWFIQRDNKRWYKRQITEHGSVTEQHIKAEDLKRALLLIGSKSYKCGVNGKGEKLINVF